MFAKTVKALAAKFHQLSLREQRLAIAVACLLALYISFRLVRAATGYIDQLDTKIDRLQADIVNFSYLITRKESVEEQYERVAAQHSSEWTQAEIHDRLRQEIYRLAERQPSALDVNGIPIGTGTASGKLVEIPAIGQGTLVETEGGFREYRLSFRIPSAELKDVVDFLDRLQMSPQALRIDGLDILRDATQSKVGTTVEISRIIAAGTKEGEDGAATGTAAKPLTVQELNATNWECEDCAAEMERDALTNQVAALYARSTQGNGNLFMPRALPAGAVYELQIDARAEGEVWLGMRSDKKSGEDAAALEEIPVVGEGQANRYTVRFTVPGNAGSRTQVRVPHFNLAAPGAALWIDRFAMDRIDQ